MGDVVQFKRPKVAQLHKGNTLCRSGFHKWEILKEKQFDVKQGKLITVYQCTRCATIKSLRCREIGCQYRYDLLKVQARIQYY